MYRTQRMWQHVPAPGQRRIAFALVAALAFTVGAAFGASGSRAYRFLTTMRQAVPPAGTSPVANHPAAPAQTFGPEDIVTLPPQIQDQVRGKPRASAAGAMAVRENTLGPEEVFTLPPQIQAQVRQATRPSPAGNAAGTREQGLGPEAILRLPPQIQEQVRRAER